jgi:hypothetical protein
MKCDVETGVEWVYQTLFALDLAVSAFDLDCDVCFASELNFAALLVI